MTDKDLERLLAELANAALQDNNTLTNSRFEELVGDMDKESVFQQMQATGNWDRMADGFTFLGSGPVK